MWAHVGPFGVAPCVLDGQVCLNEELKRASEEKVNSKEKRLSSRMLNDGRKFKIFKYTYERKVSLIVVWSQSMTIHRPVH